MGTSPSTPAPGDEEESPVESWEQAITTPLLSGPRPIYLLGRSVTETWFNHWGWEGDDDAPVMHGRNVLHHRGIDIPDNMVDSVRAVVTEIPDVPVPIIQWKFCFDDLDGADQAQRTVERNEQIVRPVYPIVVEQHRHRLVIGNALSKVAAETEPELVAAHRQFNHWLGASAAAHPTQVHVFDQYAILADTRGPLRSTFAGPHDDSHPNGAGYAALDASCFALLDRIP